METHYKAEHVHLPIPECFIHDDEEIDNVSQLICQNFLLWKKYLDMALGGRVSVFGVKFLNRIDIRNFHECYPLVNAKKLMRARCKNSFATLILILRIFKFFVFFDHPFQLFIEIRNFFFQPFVKFTTLPRALCSRFFLRPSCKWYRKIIYLSKKF